MQAQISEAVLKVAVHFKVIETNNGRLFPKYDEKR